MIYDMLPIVVTLVTFSIYTATQPDHRLRPSVAFVAFTLFNQLKAPLDRLPKSISFLIMGWVSVTRIVNFFKNEDLDVTNVRLDKDLEDAVQIRAGTFSHIRSKPVVLHNIHLTVRQGSLTAIVGSVGAGKSSLLSTLIGDMYKHNGTVSVKGSVALVAQQAFILNATVRNNILFGAEFNEDKYNRVVAACALISDFEMLPKGDKSMIGEKGINLSGGQKQRISLARAVYNDADIYLLDDPLSAVDAHVGKHIFDNVIGPSGLLNGKTRIMVTHGIHWLPEVDEIYIITAGRMSEHGTYESLLSHNGDFAKFLKEYYIDDEKNAPTDDSPSRQTSQDFDEDDDVYDEQEEVETGKVAWNVYLTYFKSMGLRNTILGLLLILVSGGFNVAYSIWLSLWTSDAIFLSNSSESVKQVAMEKYVREMSALGVGEISAVLCFTLAAAYCFCKASSNLHRTLLSNILRAKSSFFDMKPLGMILNRFSKDIDVVDTGVGWSVVYLAWTIIGLITSIGGILYATPFFVVAIIHIAALYLYIQRFYICTARQLRRLSSKASSPIYAHFSETLHGCQTIRAYKHQERFIEDNRDKIENFNVYRYFCDSSENWLDVRMAATGGLLVFLASTFCVFSTQIPYLNCQLTSSLVGLALTLVFNITNILKRMVRAISNVETNIVSVERIKEYSEVEREADWTTDNKPSRQWPSSGVIEFSKYATKYRPELDLVIKDFNFEIHSKEKIGIVGRTGAGKSSLTLALFRMIESAKGCIKIDGVDISTLGLHDLRCRLTILPQDPVLFSGSFQDNLDPFGSYTDLQLWEVLSQCQLKEYVSNQPGQLTAECGEGGKNLSVGQRQLICLARALLRKTKILIMDEATAAVDLKTDDVIQKTIRSEFANCTILTIAHRLNTIMDCDRILVMSKGTIAEFDSPKSLLDSKESIFYGMAKDAGIVE
ncbi:hypothetical protein EB796_023392 [Bugula neritina]|uniref:ABCC5 n=1 Tax=Bugula neritina TaxID=10212 RepID=A0A7J7IXP0_BUGNE|nr:hypothetical protein EB796_023392 [Bugula neritina]